MSSGTNVTITRASHLSAAATADPCARDTTPTTNDTATVEELTCDTDVTDTEDNGTMKPVTADNCAECVGLRMRTHTATQVVGAKASIVKQNFIKRLIKTQN